MRCTLHVGISFDYFPASKLHKPHSIGAVHLIFLGLPQYLRYTKKWAFGVAYIEGPQEATRETLDSLIRQALAPLHERRRVIVVSRCSARNSATQRNDFVENECCRFFCCMCLLPRRCGRWLG